MRLTLEDCYRLLDLAPGASEADLRRAHRDMTKVWHPDRFGEDAALRKKAEEKLKAINEAYETIRRDGSPPPPPAGSPASPPSPSSRGREIPSATVSAIYGIACAVLAIFILLRRPTPAGLVIALVLFGISVVFVRRMG